MPKEHPMQIEFRCDGHCVDDVFLAECVARVGGFPTQEQLTTFVLCMKPYLNEAVEKALSDAFGAKATIRRGEEHVERSGNVQ